MKEKYTYANLDYIGKHKIYCFRRSFSNINPLKREVYKYEEGDFLPLLGNNYIYASDVLIVDLKNQFVHIVEDNIYKKTITVSKNIDMSVGCYFKKKRYLSIDIYGNILNILNIFDLYRCVNSYPCVEICLEEKNKYIKSDLFKSKVEANCLTVIDNIKQFKSNGILLTGYVFDNSFENNSCEGISFDIAGQINEEILSPMLAAFEDEFIDEYDVYFISNRMLEIFDLLYSLTLTNNGKIVQYMSFGKIRVTHVDKLKKELKRIIDYNTKCDLDYIMDIIFTSIRDEKYVDFIIDTISKILDIND